MALSRSYLVTLLLYISAVNELRLPQVTCQDEEGSQCIPKHTFLALLRLPEVSSNLAAYSRSARVIQDAENRSDMAHLKALAEEGDETEVCIPSGIYLELFRDPAMRGYLSVIGRTQKFPNSPGRLIADSDEIQSRDFYPESQKRSIATLAKNGDLPITLQDRDDSEEDEEKRSITSEHMDTLLARLLNEEAEKNAEEILREYLLPNGELNMEALGRLAKRNVGALARDFALPSGRRNIASLARDAGLPNGKKNIGSLARDRMLPYSGKRNVAALARDYALPYGKRYLGSLARSGDFPYSAEKRGIAALARNSDWPFITKKGISVPGIIFRNLNRHGRSLTEADVKNEALDLQNISNQEGYYNKESGTAVPLKTTTGNDGDLGVWQIRNRSSGKGDPTERRSRRQVDYSDEYPLPVMQSANLLNYEEMLDALAERYPQAEKRFMGRIPQMGPRPTTPPTRRLGR